MKQMSEPNGTELLDLLVSLYAEQEGVKITYELEQAVGNEA